VESSKWNVERKDGKTRAKINAVESSKLKVERKDGKTKSKAKTKNQNTSS